MLKFLAFVFMSAVLIVLAVVALATVAAVQGQPCIKGSSSACQ